MSSINKQYPGRKIKLQINKTLVHIARRAKYLSVEKSKGRRGIQVVKGFGKRIITPAPRRMAAINQAPLRVTDLASSLTFVSSLNAKRNPVDCPPLPKLN